MASYLGSDIPFWNQLCFFTCFLLQQSAYDAFNEFINQIKDIIHHRQLTLQQCNEFFTTCNKYIFHSLKKSRNKLIGIKAIVHMIGLLPIDKKNFPLLDGDAEQFIAYIMAELTRSWEDVINSLVKEEWTLFKDGLVILMCTQLLSPTEKNTDTNPLELLLTESMSAERLSIVRRAVKFLGDIERNVPEPIWFELLVLDSRTNWIDKISFKRISFEVYLKCAIKILPALPQQQLFVERVGPHFDGCVKSDQFVSKLILFKMMRYLHRH